MRRPALPAGSAHSRQGRARSPGCGRDPRRDSRGLSAAGSRRYHSGARIRRATERSSGDARRLMRFLIDAQLPPALARRLVELGHDAEHVSDQQLAAATDSQIWDYALATAAVIVSKDEDFAQRKSLVENGPRLVWVRIRNTRRKEL